MHKEIIEKIITDNLDISHIKEIKPWKGKSAHICFFVDTDKGRYFLKCRPKQYERMYASQADGLKEFKRLGVCRVPEVLRYGAQGEWSFIILEGLPLLPHTKQSKKHLGEKLAALHQKNSSYAFGYSEDNYLDETLQNNAWSQDWVQIFAEKALFSSFEVDRRSRLKKAFSHFYRRRCQVISKESMYIPLFFTATSAA